jgi:hypothetical protein
MGSKKTVKGPSDLVISNKETHVNSVSVERVTLTRQKVVDLGLYPLPGDYENTVLRNLTKAQVLILATTCCNTQKVARF